MKEIENIISPLVEAQFPEFYKEEGTRFIDFVKEYYNWLQQSDQAVGAARDLFSLRDIDTTSEEFVKHYRQKYLSSIPENAVSNKRLLLKNSLDYFRAKGTERGIELAMRSIYGEPATVYFPGEDVFKLSHGTWVKPTYLELSVEERSRTYVGQEVIGSLSGAKAFVESLVRRRIQTKFIDVAYLSNIQGDFVTGEYITTTSNTVSTGAPTVVGSMTTLEVITGGADFSVGDLFDVVSSNGKQGKARVTSVLSETGTVTFEFVSPLVSGGWGYTTSSNVLISQRVLTVNTVSNANTLAASFLPLEAVKQNLVNVAYSTASPNSSGFTVGSVLENYNGGGSVAANAVIVAVSATTNTTGYLIVSPRTGNLASVDTTFSLKGNTTTAVITAYVDRSANALVVGSNSGYVGVYTTTNGFLATPYANIVGQTSNTTALVQAVSSGTGATFDIGSITDTETVSLGNDGLSSNNTANVVFSTINLNGNNSGASLQYGSPQALSGGGFAYGGFGFTKYPASNMDSRLLDCFSYEAITLGSIASLTGIDPSDSYNVDPFILVLNKDVSGFSYRDYVATISSTTGTFVTGEEIQQSYSNVAVQLTVSGFTGTAANGTSTTTPVVGEFLYQSNATTNVAASGYVVEAGISAGNGTIKIENTTGTFVVSGTYKIKTLTSGANATVTAVSNTTIATTARALNKAGSNSSILYLKRINLKNGFVTGSTIVGRSSGATATLVSIIEDSNTQPIGLNANIVANVQTSNGVVTTLDVVDSGYGYIDTENVTLTSPDSNFIVTARVGLAKQGVGNGYFSSTRGFLDSDKKIHDNEYYQEYSYEVQTKIPFDKYFDVLKQVTHVAGTRMFGRVVATSTVNTSISVINSIDLS